MTHFSDRLVYANGNLEPESKAGISIFDAALTNGEKIVEVSRTFNHKIFELEAHVDRLFQGAEEFDIPIDMTAGELMDATMSTLDVNLPKESEDTDWQIIHYASPGPALHLAEGLIDHEDIRPTLRIQCIPLTYRLGKMASKYAQGTDLVVVPQRAIPQQVVGPKIKSTGRVDHLLARKQAQKIKPGSAGVLLDHDGYVTEGTGSSLFVVKDGEIFTAPTDKALNGVTRKLVFDVADKEGIPINEVNMRPDDITDSDEAFITSTVICQVHARSFDGVSIGSGEIGSVSSKIREGFMHAVGLDFAKQAYDYSERI